MRALVCCAVLACGGSPVAVPEPRPSTEDRPAARAIEDRAAADAVAVAVRSHEVLSATSVVPASSHLLCNAAMEAIATGLGRPPAAMGWTGDGERDRALLRRQAEALLDGRSAPADLPLAVARAMAMAAKDPHAFALDAAAMGTMLGMVSGQPAAGLGLGAHVTEGGWVVADVHPGSPAEAAGVKRGELVTALDGRRFDEQSLFAVTFTAPGRAWKLEIGGRQVELIAAPFARPIVESRVVSRGLGYVRIHYLPRSEQPAGDASVLLVGALGELSRKKVSRIVLDLRDNIGGAPFEVASILVRGDPLMQLQNPGDAATPGEPIKHAAQPWKKKLELAVLVNDQSYSAAEMIALALQTHREGRIIGRPTGGGLTVPGQEQLPGGVTLFYPSRLVLDANGAAPDEQRITPDQSVPNTSAADYAAGRDPQLDAAMAWLKKR
jgi:carboxyl-terminal processing protease